MIGAKTSPRMVDNIVYWYAGNTFTWNMQFTLTDPDGNTYHIAPTDEVAICFRKTRDGAPVPREENIAELTITNAVDDVVSIPINEELSNKFCPGEYGMSVTLHGASITTLMPSCRIVVEEVC